MKIYALENFKLRYSFVIDYQEEITTWTVSEKLFVFANDKIQINIQNLFTEENY